MHYPFSVSASSRPDNRRQAYVLLLLGVVFLIVAWLGLLCLVTSGRTDSNAKHHLPDRTETRVHHGTTAMHPAKGDGR
jgi:hypothetical protein